MTSLEHAIEWAIATLRLAIPNATVWSGLGAASCAESLEQLVTEMQLMRSQIANIDMPWP